MSTHAESIFTYWKKSLSIFGKDQLRLYLLGTLATFLRASKLLIRQFWLLLLVHGLLATMSSLVSISLVGSKVILYVATIIATTFYTYVITLITRPSTEAKDLNYYKKYLSGIWVCMLMVLVLSITFTLFIPFLVMLLFFFFDTDLSIQGFLRSVRQAGLSLWYFWPAQAIICLGLAITLFFMLAIDIAISSIIGSFLQAPIFHCIICPIVWLITFSSFSVLYVKLKHEYFNLLFK